MADGVAIRRSSFNLPSQPDASSQQTRAAKFFRYPGGVKGGRAPLRHAPPPYLEGYLYHLVKSRRNNCLETESADTSGSG